MLDLQETAFSMLLLKATLLPPAWGTPSGRFCHKSGQAWSPRQQLNGWRPLLLEADTMAPFPENKQGDKCSRIEKALQDTFPKEMKTKYWKSGIIASKLYFLYKKELNLSLRKILMRTNASLGCWANSAPETVVKMVCTEQLGSNTQHSFWYVFKESF